MSDTEDRLDRLESQLDQQQETIEQQRATIQRQRQRIDALDGTAPDGDTRGTGDSPVRNRSDRDESSSTDGWLSGTGPVSRRSVLQGAAVLGLGSFATGAAKAAEPRGVVGTETHPVRRLYLETLTGPVTDGAALDTVDGAGLAVGDGSLGVDAGTGLTTDSDTGALETNVTDVGDEQSLIADSDDGSLAIRTLDGDGSVDVDTDPLSGAVTISGTDTNTDTHTDVSDDGSTVVSNTGDINFGANLSASDDGDGTATVDADVQAATKWEDGDGDGLLEPSGSNTGIEVTDLQADTLTDNGSGDVTMGNSLDMAGNNIRLTEDYELDMQPGLDTVEFLDTNNDHTTVRIGTGNPGVVSLMNANLRVRNSNSITDNFGDAFLTINSGGPLGVNKTLDLNGNAVNNAASIDNGGSAISVDDDVDLGGANLKNSNGDLTLNPSGKVKADAYYTNSVEIGEDSYHSFTPLENLGKIIVHDSDTAVGEVLFDITDDTHAPATAKVSDLHGTYIETTTGALNGTTGSDGALTISAAVGEIYIENRFIGSTTVRYTVIQ